MSKKSSDDDTGAGQAGDELAGFDNIADRFRAQEAEEQARAVERAEAATRQHASAGPERFAPPGAAEPLALELDGTTRRKSAPDIAAAIPPKPRAPSQWVTREEKSGRGRGIVVLLGLILAAGGGVAAYRYATLGYVLPAEKAEPAHLQVTVQPRSAEMSLNGKPFRGVAKLEPGSEVSLVLRAEGHLTMRGRFTPEKAQGLSAKILMGRKVPEVVPGTASSLVYPDIGEPGAAAGSDAGYEKLSVLVDCGVRLSEALAGALPASAEGEPEPVAYGLLDECEMVMQAQVGKEPKLDGLDSQSTELVAATRALNTALRDAKASAAANAKEQQTIRSAVRKASTRALSARTQWLGAMNATYARWLGDDAARLEAAEGPGVHATLRRLILASDAFARGRAGKKKQVSALRTRLSEELATAANAIAKEPQVFKECGGDQLLALVQAAFDESDPLAATEKHNAAAMQFNRLVLPIRFGPAN